MANTATDIISGALYAISSVTPGEAINGSELGYALGVLNNVLAAWSAENLQAPFRTVESFPLTIGKASYTIGQSGTPDFNTVRPDYVTFVWRRDANGLDYWLIDYTKEQYNSVFQKTLQGLPQWYYYDAQYPNGVLNLYPTDVQADTLFIESLKPIAQFSSTTATMALPGEYFEDLKYSLAERLAPEYGMTISQDLRKLMDDSHKRIKRKNLKPKAANFDLYMLHPRPFNIYTG